MVEAIKQAIAGKAGCDIVVVGKGPSIDAIDLSVIEDCIIINTNDSELVIPGDIAVFHQGWVLDIFDEAPPRCKLYVSDKHVPDGVAWLQADFVPYTPESADFLLARFFSDTIYTEHAVIVTALRVAQEIAKISGERKNVYLLGFDFSTAGGFTRKIPGADSHGDADFAERMVSSQEHLLQMILGEKSRLAIQVMHVGKKPYSVYSVDAFNKIYASRNAGKQGAAGWKQPTAKPKDESHYSVKVVAEITTNHFGDMDRLKSMIVAAKIAGADFIKLQKRDVESFYSTEKLNSPYNSPFGKTFRDYRLGIELNREQFRWVDSFCREIGIGWFASILDMPSYKFIREFDPEIIKLPSTISEHKEYLAAVATDFTKDVVISTGYTDASYEDFILRTFTRARQVFLLQCTSAYPSRNEDTQVGVVRHYHNMSQREPRIVAGFSSHDIGGLCSMMAVAAGARMLEKHVKFGDVSWSHFDEVAVDLVNGDFDRYVSDVRMAERIVGAEIKEIKAAEHHKYWVETKTSS